MNTGKLGSASPLAGTNTVVYTVNSPASSALFNVVVMNQSQTAIKVRIAISSTTTQPLLAEWLEFDTELGPRDVLERTGITASRGESVVVYASEVGLNVRVQGFELFNEADVPGGGGSFFIGMNQVFFYPENSLADHTIATIVSTNPANTLDWRFSGTGTSVSPDGYFQINSSGQVSLTSSGAVLTSPSNDFETSYNFFQYGIQRKALDGTWGGVMTFGFALVDMDDAPQSFSYVENTLEATIIGTVTSPDYPDIVDWRFKTSGTNVSDDGYYQVDALGQLTLTTAGADPAAPSNDFEVLPNNFSYSMEANVGGNWIYIRDINLVVTDASDTGFVYTPVFLDTFTDVDTTPVYSTSHTPDIGPQWADLTSLPPDPQAWATSNAQGTTYEGSPIPYTWFIKGTGGAYELNSNDSWSLVAPSLTPTVGSATLGTYFRYKFTLTRLVANGSIDIANDLYSQEWASGVPLSGTYGSFVIDNWINLWDNTGLNEWVFGVGWAVNEYENRTLTEFVPTVGNTYTLEYIFEPDKYGMYLTDDATGTKVLVKEEFVNFTWYPNYLNYSFHQHSFTQNTSIQFGSTSDPADSAFKMLSVEYGTLS